MRPRRDQRAELALGLNLQSMKSPAAFRNFAEKPGKISGDRRVSQANALLGIRKFNIREWLIHGSSAPPQKVQIVAITRGL